MIFPKGIPIKFLVLVLLCVEYNFQFVSGEIKCIEREREALLKFKKGLVDENGILSSWGSEDDKKECCKWKGVRCSDTTDHVTALVLYSHHYYLRGNITSALLELHHLKYLDLSENDFGGIKIPEFICSIERLEHLDLGWSNFSGIIPPQLGNLSNLRTLVLWGNDIWSGNLNWLSHLSLLSILGLSYSNISDTNWLQLALRLPSLQEFYCRSCMLTDVPLSTDLFVNSSSTSFSVLGLSDNQLTSSTFDWLFNISMRLVSIRLSDNQLDGPIPDAFGTLNFLEYLDLSSNMFEGEIPKSLGNLSHLQTLSLSSNDLRGRIAELFGNLESADLSHKQLAASVPKLRAFPALRELHLHSNKFTGPVLVSLSQHPKLELLDVSSNSLEGAISEANFTKLHNLKVLDLSLNSLTIHITPGWNPPFQLYDISLAGCNLGPHFPKWIQTQSNLSWLDLSYTNISDELPNWLWSFSPSLYYLSISHNQISGIIPDIFSNSFSIIDVSSNKISGPIPLFPPDTWALRLSRNLFSGSISSICKIPHSKLRALDLSNNHLGGELPNCWGKMKHLAKINLANNSFSGEIPQSLGSLQYLMTLQLRDNNLCGKLPSTLKNCRDLVLIDFGGNKLTGNIPAWIGANFTDMAFLTLRENRFYGSIPPEICNLSKIQILDLSNNNLSEKIPQCFNNFTSLVEKSAGQSIILSKAYVYGTSMNVVKNITEDAKVQWKGHVSEFRQNLNFLKLIDLSSNRLVGSIPGSFSSLKGLISLNLSRNSLTGNIIPDIGQMEMLECLDLSRNQLYGEIPTGLAQLHFLAVLDLANNNLSGKIPLGTQLQSFNASVYAENNELCGLPLTLCPQDCLSPSITNHGKHIKEKDDDFMSLCSLQEFCISMAFGFSVGFWGVVGPLVLKRSWRSAYFNFFDAVGDWLYVATIIYLNKFRRN